MKFLFHPSQFTFTNRFGGPHFNNSLLKSRIEMMNSAKSKWLGLGKYAVFIGMLWLCAAFTKPYRAKVAAKIVEKVPELQSVLKQSTASLPKLNDFVFEAPTTHEKQIVAPITSLLQDTLVSETKYVIYRDKKLYWIITPKSTLKDLADIQREFKKAGCTFLVKQVKFDPLGYFLLDIGIKSASTVEKGQCQTTGSLETGKPISSFGGMIQIGGGFCSLGAYSSENELKQIAQEDEKEVEEWFNAHRYEYLKMEFQEKRKETGNGKKVSFSEFKTEGLQYLFQTGARNQIYFEANGQLQIENFYKDAEFVIDNKTVTIEQIQNLNVKDISTVLCYAWYEDSKYRIVKRSFAVFTTNSPIKP
jgi:hypothetical protein